MGEEGPRKRFAREVVRRLRDAGHRALWAGGCVRDLLMGQEPKDYDVATDAPPERVMALFRRTVPVGISFGVVRVIGPPGAGEVEVATFRSDGAYVDGRRPESVTFGSPEVDASRRDFTINGMFLDPISGEVLDFVGGRADLAAGVVRAIGDPVARFREDKLRLLRAVRFAARFGFAIEPHTRAALRALAGEVRVVAPERIAQELRIMLVHPRRALGVELADEVGLVDVLFPELAALKGVPYDRPMEPPGDLWEHSKRTLAALEDEPPPSFPLALAALLHDTGKPLAGPGPEHAAAGARVARRLAEDLRLSNEERDRLVWLVEHHHALEGAEKQTRARLKRLLASPGIGELLALHRADALASTGDLGDVLYCERYLREQPEGPIDPPALIGGRDLIELGLKPGPEFSRILERVRDAQLEGTLTTKEEALDWVRREI